MDTHFTDFKVAVQNAIDKNEAALADMRRWQREANDARTLKSYHHLVFEAQLQKCLDKGYHIIASQPDFSARFERPAPRYRFWNKQPDHLLLYITQAGKVFRQSQ